MTDATLIAADASLDSLVHDDPEQAKHEDRGPAATWHVRWPCATEAVEPNAPQSHRSRGHVGPEAGNAAAAQIQSASDDRRRQSGHPGYGGDDRSTARQSAVSRAAPARREISYKITICEATADRGYGSADIIRTLQEQAGDHLTFRCGAAVWGTAST